MLLWIDDETHELIQGAANRARVSTLTFKRANSGVIEVRFVRSGQVVERAGGATGYFGIKEKGKYDGDHLVLANSWTKSGSGTSTKYTFTPDFSSDALNTALGFNPPTTANDKQYVDAIAAVTWWESGQKSETPEVTARIWNDINRGSETPPPVGGASALIKSANFDFAAGTRIAADTSAGAFTGTLPASPSPGDAVEVIDAKATWGTNNFTVGRNGGKINGTAADLVCDLSSQRLLLVYIDASHGWAAL